MSNKKRPEIEGNDVVVSSKIEEDSKTRNYTLKWTNPQDKRTFEQTYVMGMDYTENIDSIVKKFIQYVYSEYDAE
jgi:hypothetical protein